MFEGQHHRTPCGAHWSISPEVKGPGDPRGPSGRLPRLWNPEDFTLLLFLTLGKWYETAAVTRVLLQPSLSCRSRPLPGSSPGQVQSVWDARGGNAAAAAGTHSPLAPWWSSPVRSRPAARRPRPLRAGPANHRRFQTGPVKGRFSSSPPLTDILGDTVRKENIFLK